jgi:hypothetical protein
MKLVVADRTGTVITACRREGCCEVFMGSDADIRLRAEFECSARLSQVTKHTGRSLTNPQAVTELSLALQADTLARCV